MTRATVLLLILAAVLAFASMRGEGVLDTRASDIDPQQGEGP